MKENHTVVLTGGNTARMALASCAIFAAISLGGCIARSPGDKSAAGHAPSASGSFAKPDIDLTKFNANMVYSTVFDMMVEPEKFTGKVIKLSGTCIRFEGDGQNPDAYACLVTDAAACCANGLEFVLADGRYPAEGTDITVTGVFAHFKSHGYDSFHLVQAEILQDL